ncbi:hypothetical protein BH18ACT5_BH18ACT5_16460 [soil metagenome]
MTTVPSVHIRERVEPFEGVTTCLGWATASFLASLFLWIAVPSLLLGWKPLVVISESMAPLIRAGDLVLIDQQSLGVGNGSVIAFRTAAGEVMLHRVVGQEQGTYLTKGDHNNVRDSDPVAFGAVFGTGRLLVPYAGLPRLWGGGSWLVIAAPAGAAALAWRDRRSWAIAALVAGIALTGVARASAAFAATTSNSASSVAAATALPVSGLTAACGQVGAGNVPVNLSWTASTSPGVTSYSIYHDGPSAGTNFVEVGSLPGSQTSFTHPVPAALASTGTHTYTVRTLIGSWTSANSTTDAVSITQVVLTYTCTPL